MRVSASESAWSNASFLSRMNFHPPTISESDWTEYLGHGPLKNTMAGMKNEGVCRELLAPHFACLTLL